MEPLSFKGRRGSGIAGDRCAYADASLEPRWDWEKYVYGHRVWGRLLYNPDADPGSWQRATCAAQFRRGAPAVEARSANASRILPIVTTAHGPSAGNNTYWPEVYTESVAWWTPASTESLHRYARRPESSATSARSIRSSSPASTISRMSC